VVSERYHYKIKKNIVDEVIICVQSSKRFITYHIFYSTQQHIIKGGARRARCNAVPNHSTPKLAIGISTTFATTSGRSRPRCATITKDSRAGGPSTMHRTRMAVSRIIVFPCTSYTSNDLSLTPHTSCSHHHTAQLVERTSRDVAGGAAESFKRLEYGEILFGERMQVFV
jgi:hypothetical protein